ncbi:MAG: phage tail protein [Lachnospiraceae bacterium]|nr:phage tail protein [Lachnospiraceae bacterium]
MNSVYRTIQGQAWDQIAKEVYRDETKAGFLMEQNPDLISIFIFPEGVFLKTPSVEIENSVELPPWRK